MSLILNIDTAVQTASLCLADGDRVIGTACHASQKDQASWLQVGIRELLEEKKLSLHSVEAIAVSAGPGSYTGLRVGMATAKGLCYALGLPLITIGTLKMMAVAARQEPEELLCPMIDARRMEVFAAIFDQKLEEVMSPANLVLESGTFDAFLNGKTICFFGNGSAKYRPLLNYGKAVFRTIEASAKDMATLSAEKFRERAFADLAYSEPFYGKDFHSTIKQSL